MRRVRRLVVADGTICRLEGRRVNASACGLFHIESCMRRGRVAQD